MNIYDLLSSDEKNAKMSHIAGLYALACVDGKIDDVELEIIAKIVNREGLSEDELCECISNPEKINIEFPDDDNIKVQYLRDMVTLMICDLDVDEKEMKLCKTIAKAMEFKDEIIDALLMDIINDIKKKM